MGKVLVEKLLRSCPDIATIYLLMRPKRGNDIRARLDELLSATVSKLNSYCPRNTVGHRTLHGRLAR